MTESLDNASGTLRPMLRLALPVLLQQTLNLSVSFTDWWLTGNYLIEPDYKAAMGLMAYVMWLLPNLFAAVAIGATALVARHIGARQRRVARHVANQSLLAGIVMAVLATCVAVFCAGPFVHVMQLPEAPARLAQQYLLILIPAIPAIMIEEVGIASLHGAGDTVSGLGAKVVVNLVNIVVSTTLVTGLARFTPLGWSGLAIGTASGHFVGALIVAALLVRGRAGLRWRLRDMRPDMHLIRRLFRIGVPGGIDVAAILTCHFIFAAIVNSLGTLAAAAHGLGVQIEALAYLPGSAFQVAAATMAGQYLGARDAPRAMRSVHAALLIGGGLMSGAGLLFFFGGGPITGVFTHDSDPATRDLTIRLLRIVAVSEPFLAATMILTGALRGAGDTRWPLLFTLVGFLGVRIPAALVLSLDVVHLPLLEVVLPGYGLGVIGAWYAMVADIVVRSVLVSARFWHGGWMRTEV
ncbi:MAG: MATE family efflux transporter [Pirellulaceae bacterium]